MQDIEIVKIPYHVEWLATFIGKDFIQKQLQKYRQNEGRYKSKLYLLPRLFERNPLIPVFAAFEDWQASNNNLNFPLSPEIMQLAADAHNVQLLCSDWDILRNEKTQEIVKKRLQAEPDGILLEFRVATHYVLSGYNVDLRSIKKNDPPDIMVHSGSSGVEIECKVQQVDTGLKIKNVDFRRLLEIVIPAVNLAKLTYGITLQCTDLLHAKDRDVLGKVISDRIRRDEDGEWELEDGLYYLKIIKLGDKGYQIPIMQAQKLIEPYWQDMSKQPYSALGWHPLDAYTPSSAQKPVSPWYFICQSLKSDKIIDSISDTIKEANDQLSGRYPGVVAIHIPQNINWRQIQDNHPLIQTLQQEFGKPTRKKVTAVVFSSERPLIFNADIIDMGKPNFCVYNPHAEHKLPNGFKVI